MRTILNIVQNNRGERKRREDEIVCFYVPMNARTLVFIRREKPNEIKPWLKSWEKRSINGKNNGSRSEEKLGTTEILRERLWGKW